MSEEQVFKAGDEVEWDTPQGPTHGVVVRKLSAPMQIGGHKVAASPDNPEYLVKSERTGKEAAHRPGALRKR